MKKKLYDIFERAILKIVLHLLKVSGTFQTYLVSMLIEYGFEKVIIPLIESLITSSLLIYDKQMGKIRVKNLHRARKDKNIEEYNRNIDAIFG